MRGGGTPYAGEDADQGAVPVHRTPAPPAGSVHRRRRCGVDRELLATIAAVLGLVAAALELCLAALQLRRERRPGDERGVTSGPGRRVPGG